MIWLDRSILLGNLWGLHHLLFYICGRIGRLWLFCIHIRQLECICGCSCGCGCLFGEIIGLGWFIVEGDICLFYLRRTANNSCGILDRVSVEIRIEAWVKSRAERIWPAKYKLPLIFDHSICSIDISCVSSSRKGCKSRICISILSSYLNSSTIESEITCFGLWACYLGVLRDLIWSCWDLIRFGCWGFLEWCLIPTHLIAIQVRRLRSLIRFINGLSGINVGV